MREITLDELKDILETALPPLKEIEINRVHKFRGRTVRMIRYSGDLSLPNDTSNELRCCIISVLMNKLDIENFLIGQSISEQSRQIVVENIRRRVRSVFDENRDHLELPLEIVLRENDYK